MVSSSDRKRVLVIGIDGGTFRVIDRLASEGKLPHFGGMFRTGCRAVLESTLPPITAPAWTSFSTGKNPGKHGLFNFMTFKKGTYEIELVNATSIKSRQLWHYFHDNKRPFVLLNVPVTYPPLELGGTMVSGLLTPPGKICTHPPEIAEELRERGYETDVSEYSGVTRREYFESVKRMSTKRFEIASEWIREKTWEFFMVVFVGSDRIQHKLWDRQEWVAEYYTMLDGYIGRLVELAGEDTYVILMSDHGFTSQDKTFYVNEWLASLGLLQKRSKSDGGGLRSWGTAQEGLEKKSRSRVYKFLERIGFSSETRRKLIPNWIWFPFLKALPKSLRGLVPAYGIQIDWRNTRAYANSARPIYVNLKGREVNGTVEPGEEYQSVVREVKEGLLGLVDPNTGERPFKNVFTREELFTGPYEGLAPDVLFYSDDFSYCLRGGGTSKTKQLFKNTADRISNHDLHGIFMMSGPGSRKGADLGTASIMDLAPTILHIMGIPVPDDMDGKVLTQAFESDSALARDVQFQEAPEYTVETEKKTTDAEEEELQNRLKDLGYLT